MSRAQPLTAPPALLGPTDPPPFELFNPEGAAPILFVCDHAGRAIPAALGRLGLD
jgi:predicted N-formylglutamate amidohydrolase